MRIVAADTGFGNSGIRINGLKKVFIRSNSVAGAFR
jgi:hypothetical protein